METYLIDEQVEEILKDYKKKQLTESLTGPIISFLTHSIILLLLFVFVTPSSKNISESIQVVIEEIEVIQPPPPPKEIEVDIKELENQLTNETPPIETIDIPSEEPDIALESFNDEAPESNDDSDLNEYLDVVPHPTTLKLTGLYGGRNNNGKAGKVKEGGGTKKGQNAVYKALKWLQKVQLDNGSWEDDPAHSGLALLCFLAYGATPLDQEFGETVKKSMQWLCNNLPEDRCWDRAYSHGIATYAISEAYGMTKIPFLKNAMERGIKIIIDGQQECGGYDYNYKKGNRWDVSVSGWQFQALKAAYVSGSSNPKLYQTMKKSREFLKKHAYGNKEFAYSNGKFNHKNMTGIGVVSLQLLGDPSCKEVSESIETIIDKRLNGYVWEEARKNLYGWYYDTQAVFQYKVINNEYWKKWQRIFEKELVRNQHKEGYWKVDGINYYQNLKGKIFSTTLCCLQLEVYYRYLPTFRISKNFTENIENIEDIDLIIE